VAPRRVQFLARRPIAVGVRPFRLLQRPGGPRALGEDPLEAGWRLVALPMAGMYLLAPVLVEIWLATAHPALARPAAVFAACLVAHVTSVLLLLVAHEPRRGWVVHGVLAGGTALVSLAAWGVGTAEGGLGFVYVWVAPYAFLTLRRRPALAYTAAVTAALVASVALLGPWGGAPMKGERVGWAIFGVGTLVVTTGTVAHIVATLRRGHAVLRRAVADAAMGMALLDPDLRWTDVNPALCAMLGRPPAELLGRPIAEVMHPEDARATAERPDRHRPAVGEVRRAEERFLRGDGSVLWASVTSGAVADESGRVRLLTLQIEDVSERKAAEAALRDDASAARSLDAVRRALDEDRLVLRVQPIVELEHGATVAHEVLARLLAPDGSLVPPGKFLPAVERFGLNLELDLHVLRRAAALAAHGTVSINVSARTVGRAGLVEGVRAVLAESGVDPRRLVFEITETALTEDVAAFSRFGRELVELGCRLALDDFGTGYGTLTYLTQLPAAFIKIDARFVRALGAEPAAEHVVRAIVELAHGLGQRVVAEGVEEPETVGHLRACGVDLAQGYLFGRPGPPEPPSAAAVTLGAPPGRLVAPPLPGV
jgi:PAS domain S-box-containing protein